jgi:phage terminase large subunit-like protein
VSDELAAQQLRGISAELFERMQSTHPFYSWKPHPKQLRAMKSQKRHVVVLGANRTGKSDVIHRIATERFMGWSPVLTREFGRLITYKRPINVWVSALDANVSRDVSEEKVRGFIPPDAIAKKLITWRAADRLWRDERDGSTIGFKSADSGRSKYQGTSREVIVLDEEHPEDIYNECYARTIDCGGQIIMGFTALQGLRWLHKLLFDTKADEDFLELITMGLVDNPYIPVKEIELAKKRYTGDELRIRVYGDFILRIGSPFFAREDVEAQLPRCESVETKNRIWQGRLYWSGTRVKTLSEPEGRLKIFAAPRRDRFYAVGGDVSGGAALGDYSCAQVIDATEFKQVAVWHGHMDPGRFAEELVALATYYNKGLIVPEINQHGMGTLAVLERLGYPNIYRRQQQDKLSEEGHLMANIGWYTDARTKGLACNQLKDVLRDIGADGERILKLYDRDTVEELRLFGYLTEDAPRSSHGLGAVAGNDDRVMALALALQGCYQVGSPPGALASLPTRIGDVLMDDAQGIGHQIQDHLEAASLDAWDDDFD